MSAVAGAAIGIAGLAFALWTPLTVTQDCVAFEGASGTEVLCRRSLSSLFDQGGLSALGGLLIPAALFAAAGIAGWAHTRGGNAPARRVLWLMTGVLGALCLALMFSLGPFMLPGVLLLLYASLLARGSESAPSEELATA